MRVKRSNRELLLEKCDREFKKFCISLPWGSRKQIIDKAGEIAEREEILNVLLCNEFTDEIDAFLLQKDNTMDFLYSEYLERDDLSLTNTIVDMIEDITGPTVLIGE